jgi:hypothetical protein
VLSVLRYLQTFLRNLRFILECVELLMMFHSALCMVGLYITYCSMDDDTMLGRNTSGIIKDEFDIS